MSKQETIKKEIFHSLELILDDIDTVACFSVVLTKKEVPNEDQWTTIGEQHDGIPIPVRNAKRHTEYIPTFIPVDRGIDLETRAALADALHRLAEVVREGRSKAQNSTIE